MHAWSAQEVCGPCLDALPVLTSATCCRKWIDDYYWMIEKEFGNERARLVAESMTCGADPDPDATTHPPSSHSSCARACFKPGCLTLSLQRQDGENQPLPFRKGLCRLPVGIKLVIQLCLCLLWVLLAQMVSPLNHAHSQPDLDSSADPKSARSATGVAITRIY